VELNLILASSCRQKIIKVLSEVKEINLMGLVRKTNSTYNQISRNVEILAKEQIVKVACCGRLKLIKLNMESPRAKALLKALQILNRQEIIEKSPIARNRV
jgi:hypothetical protein